MPRNETLPLDSSSHFTARRNLGILQVAQQEGTPVRFLYTKRTDNSVSTREGTVLAFHGSVSQTNGSVRMDTPTGERTFNLYLMANITKA